MEDLPFKDVDDPNFIVETLLDGVLNKELDLKKKIKEELRRWHPDKFKQKHGNRMKEDQEKDIMGRVNVIAQSITNYGK